MHDRGVFISIGVNHETQSVAVLGFSRDREAGKRKEIERQGEEGMVTPLTETFEIKDGWSAEVRRWLRRTCDMPLTDIQQVCESLSEAVLELISQRLQPTATDQVPK